MTVTFLGTAYECSTAIKGPDYVHLLDANGLLTASFEKVVDFSVFTLSGGSWTAPTPEDECYIAVVGDDGVVRKGSHKCVNYADINEVPLLQWSRRIPIPANANLNTYTDAGSYYILDAAIAATLIGTPSTKTGGFFDVYHRTDTLLYQEFTTWTGASIRRYLSGSNWSSWQHINDGGNASTVNGHTVDIDVPAACTQITDWNTATTTGWYMACNASNAPTTDTTNSARGWYMGYVITHNTNYVYQEVYQFTASEDAKSIPKYIRARGNGTWGAWTNVTVAVAVPADAKFTDTVYTHPNGTAKTGNPTANQTPGFGSTFTVTQFTSNATGHITGATDRTVKIPNTTMTAATASAAGKIGLVPAPAAGAQGKYLRGDGTWQTPPDTTYGAASTTANGLMTTGAQTFAGNKGFNGVVDFNGASAIGTAQGRNIYATTTDLEAGVTALETGAIALVYE